MTSQIKQHIRHVIISILIGAGITFISQVLEGLLNLVRDTTTNLTGAGAGIVYYIRSRQLGA